MFQVEGIFDVRSARRVSEYIEGAAARGRVRVDLTKVTQFDDFGIAVLAQTLKHARLLQVSVVGLRMHQLRLLRYFGIEPVPPGLLVG